MGFLKDLLTLDVLTVTGNINVDRTETKDTSDDALENVNIEKVGEEDYLVFDFDSLIKRQKGKVKLKSSLRVIAASHVEIDYDTLHFIAAGLSPEEDELVKMHLETVSKSMEARAAVIGRLAPFKNLRKGDASTEEKD